MPQSFRCDSCSAPLEFAGGESRFQRCEFCGNQILPVVNVLPITSLKPKLRIYPNEALISAGTAGLSSESIVLCYQIRTLDKQRLTKDSAQLAIRICRAKFSTRRSFK